MATAPGPSGRKRKYVWACAAATPLTRVSVELWPRRLGASLCWQARGLRGCSSGGQLRRGTTCTSRPGGWSPLCASLPTLALSLTLTYPSPRPSPFLTPSVPRLAIPMVRMDPFTWPAEFPDLFPISLCVGSALAAMGRCPFCSCFLVCFTL